MLGIDGHATLAGVALAKHEVDQVLQVEQRFTPAPDEDTEIVATYVNHCQGGPSPITRRHRFAKADLGFDFEDAEKVVDDTGREVDFLGINVRLDDWFVFCVTPFTSFAPFPGAS